MKKNKTVGQSEMTDMAKTGENVKTASERSAVAAAEGKVTDGMLSKAIITAVVGIAICLFCLIGLTWAWYNASAGGNVSPIESAEYLMTAKVFDGGAELPMTDGRCLLDPSKTYTVSLNAAGSASTGFGILTCDGTKFYAPQLAPDESHSFTLCGFTEVTFESRWGTSSFEGERIGSTLTPASYGDPSLTEHGPDQEESPTPTPLPETPVAIGPFIHVVASGETLSSIAALYGVTVEKIVAANGVSDPDLIVRGQQLLIPAREE